MADANPCVLRRLTASLVSSGTLITALRPVNGLQAINHEVPTTLPPIPPPHARTALSTCDAHTNSPDQNRHHARLQPALLPRWQKSCREHILRAACDNSTSPQSRSSIFSAAPVFAKLPLLRVRSEERRVGKE